MKILCNPARRVSFRNRFFNLAHGASGALLFTAICAAGQSVVPAAVQVDLGSLLNDRVVFTQQDGKLQPASHALDTSAVSVLITKGAAAVAQSGPLTPLPDSDLFAANERHPEVKLHYAQPGGGPQVHRSPDRKEAFAVAVPAHRYSQMQLFFISAQGETPLSVKLIYADGSVDLRATRVPDFFFLPKDEDKGWFVLTGDFGKVDLKGKMTEATHHYLHGFDLNPDAGKVLREIEIMKEDSGSVLNFFGATGTLDETKTP